MPKITSGLILKHIYKRHEEEPFFTEVKNGPTQFSNHLLKLDALAFKKSWANPCMTGYEVKVDRNDFLRDIKWPGYKAYCNKLYFACPRDLIKPEELSEDVGLIYYNPEKDTIFTKKQALFREIEIPIDMLLYLITARYSKDYKDPYPFFNSRKDFFEAWLQDKTQKQELGWNVKNRMSKLVEELQEENKKLRDEKEQEEDYKSQVERAKQIMKDAGISPHYWRDEWLENLREALKTKFSLPMANSIYKLDAEIKVLKSMIELKGDENKNADKL